MRYIISESALGTSDSRSCNEANILHAAVISTFFFLYRIMEPLLTSWYPANVYPANVIPNTSMAKWCLLPDSLSGPVKEVRE